MTLLQLRVFVFLKNIFVLVTEPLVTGFQPLPNELDKS